MLRGLTLAGTLFFAGALSPRLGTRRPIKATAFSSAPCAERCASPSNMYCRCATH
jgi:hypothetical protein